MAGETLKIASQLLADFPDNTAGLIDAVQSRNFLISVAVAVGFVEDDQAQVPYIIPMTDGVPVPFMPTLVAPLFFGNFWKLDGNNEYLPSYVDQGVTVPAGSFRLINGSVLLNVQKVGNATPVSYEFQGTGGGSFVGDPVSRDINSTARTESFSGSRIEDVSIMPAQGLSITPIGHSEDLQINDVRVVLQGIML